jgi:flagellar hook-length control protein FliK
MLMTSCSVQSFVPTADVAVKTIATTVSSGNASAQTKGFAGLFKQEMSASATTAKSSASQVVLGTLQKNVQSSKQTATDTSLDSLLALFQGDSTSSSSAVTTQELLALARVLQSGQATTTESTDATESLSAIVSSDQSDETTATDSVDLMSALLGMMGLAQQQSSTVLPSIKNLSDLLGTLSTSSSTGTQAQVVQALGSVVQELQSLLQKVSNVQTPSAAVAGTDSIAALLGETVTGTDSTSSAGILASVVQVVTPSADFVSVSDPLGVSLDGDSVLPDVLYFVSDLVNALPSDMADAESAVPGLLAVDLSSNDTQSAVEKLQSVVQQLDDARRNKPQEKLHDAKATDASLAALAQQQSSVTTVASPATAAPTTPLDSVVPQTQAALTDMVDRMRGSVQFDSSSMKATIQLDPPALGHVQIQLTIDDNNNVQAHVGSDNPDTQSFLQQHQQDMRDELARQGFKKDQVEFTFEELEPAAA